MPTPRTPKEEEKSEGETLKVKIGGEENDEPVEVEGHVEEGGTPGLLPPFAEGERLFVPASLNSPSQTVDLTGLSQQQVRDLAEPIRPAVEPERPLVKTHVVHPKKGTVTETQR